MPYSEYHPASRKRSASQNALSKFTTTASTNTGNHSHSISSVSLQQSSPNLSDLLEPAVEGPPSPERLRQLNKQMKRASHLNRGHGHRTASSGSSSLQSFTSDRTGVEQSLENISLTRRSSNRSTASNSPSRDRPDSFQVLGKNLFHRRGKLSKSRRESSAPGSSNSSLYSAEAATDSSVSTLKESLLPNIFSRRKTSRDDSGLQKRLQISGPFNFQHVGHTNRGHLVDLPRPTGVSGPAVGSDVQELHLPNVSAEEIDTQSIPPISRASFVPRHTAPAFGARRMLKHSRSQDQLRTSPPRPPVRPPRSPIEPTSPPTFPPVPPPRFSSRQSMLPGGDPPAAAYFDRPLTSNSFRQPQPFGLEERQSQVLTGSHGHSNSADSDHFAVDEHRFSHAITTPGDAAWPLMNQSITSFESPLPDVPEEEEQFVFTQRSRASRASRASNNSSLRGSHSVPLLRAFAQAQRPMSGGSDTLGCLDTSAAQQGVQDGKRESCGSEISPIRESWEDDIDYCYEHEADANFNYEWERPSLDVGRDSIPPPVRVALAKNDSLNATPSSTAESSPGMLSASRFDVPALSPTSQASTAAGHEAITPSSTLAVANNFSFPRGEKSVRASEIRRSRSGSQASSFKESYGFTLSPSLLIPGDYHQQMLLSETEKQGHSLDGEPLKKSTESIIYEENTLGDHHSSMMFQSRSSIATTDTYSTTISDSTGERHVSANSTYTNLTRFTSSTSLNKMAGSSYSETADHVVETHLADPQDDSDEETTPPATKDTHDTVPDLTAFPSVPSGKKSFHKSHASESVLRDELGSMKSAEANKARRSRARTASLSTQAPPVGQYALFPRTYAKGSVDRV